MAQEPVVQQPVSVFDDVTEDQLGKIRQDFPSPPFDVKATKKNGTYDVRITKPKKTSG